jgi:RNA polymerase sigma-70 factor (ECF subfamily)
LKEQGFVARLKSPETRSAAFEQMVTQYQQMLYYHIRRMVRDHQDADDVLQNTFMKAWRYMDRFRGDSAVRTWLYRIATNEALTFLSNKKKQQFADLGELEDNLAHSQGLGLGPDADEIQQKLQSAISRLPERQRLVFSLRYYDELKYDEIAKITDVSVGGLKASYHHAVKKVEQYLKNGG